MAAGDFSASTRPAVSARYRFTRALVRAWIRILFRPMRLLNPDSVPESGAILLLVSHPASFLDAVLLIAAFEREVHCFLASEFLRGPARRLLAWVLGMTPYEQSADRSLDTIGAACDSLARGQAALLFAEEQIAKAGEAPRFSPIPAEIAMRAEARTSLQLGLEVLPVHLFLPVAQLYTSELLVHVGAPLIPKEYLVKGGNMSEQARWLALAAETACRQNVFRLHAGDVNQFLADLEEVFRADLREAWNSRPNWKQSAEGFRLSRFVAEWVEQLNGLHPGQLVAFRDFLNSYQEASRRYSLHRLEVEQSGAWIKTLWRRFAGWAESVLGLPVAVYGFANHLAIGLILFQAGLFSTDESKNATTRWTARGLVVVGCYAIQILLCANRLGRTVAGYYALTLPSSGLYLWRYWWLLRKRSRPLLLNLHSRREAGKLERMRNSLIQEVNAARDVYADRLGLAH